MCQTSRSVTFPKGRYPPGSDTDGLRRRGKDPPEYRFPPAHTFDSYYIYPIKRAYGFYMR